MLATCLDRIGNWNPQLLRELKGRLTLRNGAIVTSLSVFGQLLLILLHLGQLPPVDKAVYLENPYCTGPKEYSYTSPQCLTGFNGEFIINWSSWWQDLFILLSIFSLLLLLVGGSYLIISDLSKEERQGTLNFIRLSPQPAQTILWGKLLGVPVLFYLMLLLTLPLSIYAGLAGQLSPATLVCYYSIVVGSCLFFYSLSLMFGLVTTWLGSLQAWVGSGTFFLILSTYTLMNTGGSEVNNVSIWPRILFPTLFVPGLETSVMLRSSGSLQLSHLQWFYLPIGLTTIGITAFTLVLYGVGTYWIWQVLKRRFRTTHATILTKVQSYTLTAILQGVMLGFMVQPGLTSSSYHISSYHIEGAWIYMLSLNLYLGLFLMAALMPQRTVLVEWARYRYVRRSERQSGLRQWLKELTWGENSPAFLAIVLNLLILAIAQGVWIGLTFTAETASGSVTRGQVLLGTVLALGVLLVYAAIVQLCLLSASPRRTVLAAGTIVVAMLIPPIILAFLGLAPNSYNGAPFWLLTAFPWVAVEYTLRSTFLFACVSQCLATTLLNLQFARRLHRLGESASKALLTPST